VRTAIVSDLHLGSACGEDVVRDAGIRRVLLEEIATADRLVLLGDVLELRELPLATVLESVEPFFADLGKAMGDRPVVLVPGNHDHRLAEPVLEELATNGGSLGLQHRAEPAGRLLIKIADWLGDVELSVAYPGFWIRDDIYATHGHYMDCHMSLPRLECLTAAAMMRAFGSVPNPAVVEDYERTLRPIYGLSDGLVPVGITRSGIVRKTRPSELAWRAIAGRNRHGRIRRAALRAAIGAGVPATVWTLNRLLRAEFKPDLSAAAISDSGISAATELARRLQIEAPHVITGHTHRAGPNESDGEWALPGGGRLHNTGSWVFASAFHRPGIPPGPYWPGTVTWVEDGEPPRRVRLLTEHSREELKATVRRLRSRPKP
jgi:UDP-2,3-diacylglucosamine pyrophosphatase LpxH